MKVQERPSLDVGREMQTSPSVCGGHLTAVFQPIENMRTGDIVGFEALARIAVDGRLLGPTAFLPSLHPDELKTLFCEMLGQAIALLRTLPRSTFCRYVSVNVDVSLVLSDEFPDLIEVALRRHSYEHDRTLVLELLEGHEITDRPRMRERLNHIRGMGIAIALDDIGSAYSSLIHLRDLPIDIMKLDQAFARELARRPEDLHFVLSIQGLAHSIGKHLVVEGVETPDIHDALRVLGVELAQGYAIARPMPGEAVPGWLTACKLRAPDRTPRSLLGAYASHLKVVETCRVLMSQPLPVSWKEESKNPHACAIGVYFDRNGLHDTPFGEAHRRFHEVMALYDTDLPRWQAGASEFRSALERAMCADALPEFRCDVV